MIKSQKEIMLINLIGFVSSGVSYIFTILMLMSFAETNLEKFLYFMCGVINDGVKWFTLITLIKYYRAKLYKNFVAYSFLFLLFAGMSMIASISFSVYTVKKQMYDVKIVENTAYMSTISQIDKINADIITLETEKISEINRLNSELDGLPLDYITRRQQLSDKKIELTNFYDNKIQNLKNELDIKVAELNSIDTKETEVRVLKNNAIAGFFETISTVTKISIDNIILAFAVALGVILDVASIALTFDSSFSYQNKRSFNKDMTNYRNIRKIKKELDSKTDELTDEEDDGKILTYSDFIKYIDDNSVQFENIKYSNFKSIMSKANFYNFYYLQSKNITKYLYKTLQLLTPKILVHCKMQS